MTSSWPEWDAYADTHVDVWLPDGAQAVLRRADGGESDSSAWPYSPNTVAWILTACNPRSVLLDEQVNTERHDLLRDQLVEAGCVPYDTVGRDATSDWVEPGVLVVGEVGELILNLAHEWEQNAVFRWTPDALAIVGVLQPGEHTMPWVLELAKPI